MSKSDRNWSTQSAAPHQGRGCVATTKGVEDRKDDGQTFVYRDLPPEKQHVPLT